MLEKFKTFVALAKYKSFTKTAQHLFCSQPTISQHIKILETTYQVRLIQRQKGDVILTEKGQKFLQYICSILDLHEQLEESMRAPEKPNDSLEIYVSHYLSSHFFDELFSDNNICGECPYKIQSLNYMGLKQALIDEKTNFAMMPYYAEDEEISERFTVDILFEEELVLLVSKNHPLANHKVIDANDLQDENILLPLNAILQQRIRSEFEKHDVFPHFSQMSDFTLIQKAVCLNMGMSFVPKNSIDEQQRNFVVKEVKGMRIMRQNAMVTNQSKVLNQLERAYCDSVKLNLKS